VIYALVDPDESVRARAQEVLEQEWRADEADKKLGAGSRERVASCRFVV